MNYRAYKTRKKYRRTIVVVVSILILVLALGTGSGFLVWRWYQDKHPIPTVIRLEATFPLFYPNQKYVNVNKSTIKYDSTAKLLSFTGSTPSGSKLIFSEEPTPSQFNDIPGYYTALLNNMNEYQEIDTIDGQMYLTKPESVNGNQSAVMSTKGTLMFVRAEKNLSVGNWQQLFNNLTIIN